MNFRPGRIAVGAIVMELLAVWSLTLIFPVQRRVSGLSSAERTELIRNIADWVGPLSASLFALLAAWWIGRKLAAGHVPNGIALAVSGSMLYGVFLVSLGAPFRWIFVAAVASRFAGAMAGASIAKRRAAARVT
jgi:hypothetical protein